MDNKSPELIAVELNARTMTACTTIRNHLLSIIGQTLAYAGWSDELCRCEGRLAVRQLDDKFGKTRPDLLTEAQLIELGFGNWDESGLRLIPIWLHPFVDDATPVKSISGKDSTFGEHKVDTDVRFNVLSYGVMPAAPIAIPAPEPEAKSFVGTNVNVGVNPGADDLIIACRT